MRLPLRAVGRFGSWASCGGRVGWRRRSGGVGRWGAGLVLAAGVSAGAAEAFTRLQVLPAPRIVAAAEAVAVTGNNPVENLIDGDAKTEYASAGKGLQTWVEFDFGSPQAIAAFRHQDRKNGTIAGSELVFFDGAGREVARRAVAHADRSGAVVFFPLTPAITARRVRWQVTRLGAGNAGAVGGAEIAFFARGASEVRPTGLRVDAVALPIATPEAAGSWRQPLRVTVDSPYLEPVPVEVRLAGQEPRQVTLAAGPQTLEYALPVAETERTLALRIAGGGAEPLVQRVLRVPAFRRLTLYVVPHSHLDIGFTESQTAIEEKQLHNLRAGLAEARRTAEYPEGARFVWNVEGLWSVDLWRRRLGAEEWRDFGAAVQRGQVALHGMYFNTLTGLCHPEELVRLFRFGTRLREELAVPVDSAMISDVAGYTWGLVPALAQAGIRYLSAAPNVFDRIGDIYVQWENKPFWWVGPAARDRVLVWVPLGGYNLAARIGRLSAEWMEGWAEEMVRSEFPYEVAYLRWSRGDNAAPDAAVCDQVRAWNAAHPWPKVVIGSVHDAFGALERRHGAQLPSVRGDWTPYWEDGAASSAQETATNRASSDRLTQAEALWALVRPGTYPAADYAEAWRYVLQYDEHTWGASTSVTVPNSPATLEQWAIKQSYAAAAAAQARELLARAQALTARGAEQRAQVDVYNTGSWARSELVVLAKDVAVAGDRVTDDTGAPVPAQRLVSGELAFWAAAVPPFAARRYTLTKGPAAAGPRVTLTAHALDNGRLRVEVDPRTGEITMLRRAGGPNLVAAEGAAGGLNSYLYFNGDDPTTARRNAVVTLRPREKGPLVASLVAESAAPGCHLLSREIRLVAGAEEVELSDLIDKARLVAANYRAPEGKESVSLGFPFHVPGGQVRLQVPFGVVRPDDDQIPGAGKNWFTLDRWADVANAEGGVTLASLDAPLVQVGGLTANLLNSQTNPAVWRKRVGPAQALYVWVMNNHWGTNYRAFQEGPTTFRFRLRPHGGYEAAAAARWAQSAAQPLVAVRAYGPVPSAVPRLAVDAATVLVTGLKPSDDGRAVIVRLWNAAERDVRVRLRWSDPVPTEVFFTDTGEAPLRAAPTTLELPAWGVVALRAKLP